MLNSGSTPSLHAVALLNLAELASGLAILSGLPPTARAIVTGLRIEYRKKARGTVVAESTCAPRRGDGEQVVEVEAVVRDRAGEVVAVAAATWQVGPRPEAAT